jgi:hypothetical protein
MVHLVNGLNACIPGTSSEQDGLQRAGTPLAQSGDQVQG